MAEKYVHKGDKLYVEGKLRYRSYDDKRGVRQYVTEVYADNMELLTPKKDEVAATRKNVTESNPVTDNQDNDMPF